MISLTDKKIPTFKKAIILFFKEPIVGKTKTRLGSTMGMKKATFFYKEMLNWRLASLKQLTEENSDLHLFFAIANKPSFWYRQRFLRQWSDAGHLCLQQGNDLGERMTNAFSHLLSDYNYQKVILMGSDIPFLSHEIVNKAFRAINKNDVVLGPCSDGGYYLIGLKKYQNSIFSNIKWSNTSVLNDTLGICKKELLTVFQTKELFDIDTEKEFKILRSML